MTSVDVFIPCYNYGRFLKRCVDSVLSQDGMQVRVLIIDDTSTDNSLEEARRIAAQDSRVSVLAHPVNKGHIATYNEGIAWASAPYMVLVSADDLLAPMALSRSIALMEAHPGVGFVFGPLCQFDDRANNEAAAVVQARAADPSGSVIPGRDFIAGFCRRPLPLNLVPASGVVVRTAFQQRLGGYLPELPHSGDLEMWLRMAAHADIGVLRAPTALTRIHTTNMRNVYHADRSIADYRQRALAFRRFFERQSEHIFRAGDLARDVRRLLAEEVIATSDRCFDDGAEADAARVAAVAQEIDPTITHTGRWWKAAAKRTAGWHWCQAYGRSKALLLGVAATTVEEKTAIMSTPPDSVAAATAPVTLRSLSVLFCCDPGYYQHLAVALASLLKNNQRRPLDITVVASARDAEAERKLVSVLPAHPDAKVTIRHFGLEKFHALHTSEHITTETYLRILALDMLPPECGKIIYLDCDLVVVSALDGLWEVDISEHALAAVPDPYGAERPEALGMPAGAAYVNAGVLLINVQRWREQNLAARVIAYAEQAGSRLRYHDQDAINALLHAEIRVLPFRWNCQARMFGRNQRNRALPARERTAIAAATRDPAIIHFTTAEKPWMFTAFVSKRDLYRGYLALTAWRDAPPTRRSLADLPEALYNRIAYACGSSCSFGRFLRATNVGRVLVRSGRLARLLGSFLRPGALPSAHGRGR